MTLADRLNKIIDEKNISKREFAKQVGADCYAPDAATAADLALSFFKKD